MDWRRCARQLPEPRGASPSTLGEVGLPQPPPPRRKESLVTPFSNILAYVDDRAESLAALETGLMLTRRGSVRLSLVDVVDGFDEELDLLPSNRDRLELKRQVTSMRRKWLERRIAPYVSPEHVPLWVTWGSPTVEIIRTAVRHDHDLIVKAARGGSDAYFGSTALHLIRKAPCPVWLAAPVRLAERPRVVAAVNPGLSGDGPTEMSRRVLSHAVSVADAVDGELCVVYAIEQLSPTWLSGTVSSEDIEEVKRRVKRRVSENLASLCATVAPQLKPTHIHAVEGSPAVAVPRFAETTSADVVVMGTVGHNLDDGLLVGEVVETLLQRLHCSVCCVKPEHFVSPVRMEVNRTS
jgi:universal stress protein E